MMNAVLKSKNLAKRMMLRIRCQRVPRLIAPKKNENCDVKSTRCLKPTRRRKANGGSLR